MKRHCQNMMANELPTVMVFIRFTVEKEFCDCFSQYEYSRLEVSRSVNTLSMYRLLYLHPMFTPKTMSRELFPFNHVPISAFPPMLQFAEMGREE